MVMAMARCSYTDSAVRKSGGQRESDSRTVGGGGGGRGIHAGCSGVWSELE